MTCECTRETGVERIMLLLYLCALCDAAVIETVPPKVFSLYYLQSKVYHARNCPLSCQIQRIYILLFRRTANLYKHNIYIIICKCREQYYASLNCIRVRSSLQLVICLRGIRSITGNQTSYTACPHRVNNNIV